MIGTYVVTSETYLNGKLIASIIVQMSRFPLNPFPIITLPH